jgi:hypothetical protein
VAMLLLVSISGCTSWALERTTISQAESAMDLRYRQVIENLALVNANPTALPAYSTIFSGTADVNDNVKLTSVTSWARTAVKPFGFMTAFSTESVDVLGSRAIKNTWALDPTIVPEKLRAMRAICCWVTHGEQAVEEADKALLESYQAPDYEKGIPGSPKGYYFGVIERVRALPDGWLNCVDHRRHIPRRACYWAGCHGKYVWVGAEGMEGFSEFTLIMQGIARVQFATLFYPPPRTRTIARSIPFNLPPEPGAPASGSPQDSATVTVYLDEDGLLTPGEGQPAIPPKVRYDNVGQYSQLTSIVNASSKSP